MRRWVTWGAPPRGRRWLVQGPMSEEIVMSAEEEARQREYARQGMGFGEGEHRRAVQAQAHQWRQWRKNAPPASAFFERKQYEDYVANYVSGGDLTPAMSWAHFPHPAQVCRDLSERGQHGAGVRFRDKQMGYIMHVIARRVGTASRHGDDSGAQGELQQAIGLYRYAKERTGHGRPTRHDFGRISTTALMQCYVRSGQYAGALNLYDASVAKGTLSPQDPYATAVALTVLCRLGRAGDALAAFQTGWRDGWGEYVRMCGETLLTEVLKRAEPQGAGDASWEFCVRVRGVVTHADRAVPASAEAVVMYVAAGLRCAVPQPDLLAFLVDRLPYLAEYDPRRSQAGAQVWDQLLAAPAARAVPDFLVEALALAPAAFLAKPSTQHALFRVCACPLSLPAARRAAEVLYAAQGGAAPPEESGDEGDTLHTSAPSGARAHPLSPRTTADRALRAFLRHCLRERTRELSVVGLTVHQQAREAGCALAEETTALAQELARAALARSSRSLAEGP
eukprot:TRINITY_DN15939_c0_g1_i1.p1 TRINITY_DN15939_c0_g1~~TRINITY_DN15939_c0_g1_i1.p1  ORF type:complete len:508 (+),score=130.55 TRINITY_DN15939_c0_g1_i1:93-1616(+)